MTTSTALEASEAALIVRNLHHRIPLPQHKTACDHVECGRLAVLEVIWDEATDKEWVTKRLAICATHAERLFRNMKLEKGD